MKLKIDGKKSVWLNSSLGHEILFVNVNNIFQENRLLKIDFKKYLNSKDVTCLYIYRRHMLNF